MASTNIASNLASAMAAATMASQQAAQYAAASDTAAFAFRPIPSQHWELLRVAELFSTSRAAVMAAPPLFLPCLGPSSAPPTAIPRTPPPISVGSAPVSSVKIPIAAVPANSSSLSLYSALPAPLAAKAALSQSSPTHGEPKTPELAPAILRSLNPVPAVVPEACSSPVAADPWQLSVQTVVGRPIAIRPVPRATGGSAFVSVRPLAIVTPLMQPCESPPSIPSPGAAFSPVVKPLPDFRSMLQQHFQEPAPQSAATPAAATPLPVLPAGVEIKSVLVVDASIKGTRKRRSTGPSSPLKCRATSPETGSVTEEGCGDSMERASGYKGRFCGRLFLKEDEKRLAVECEVLGPLVGFPAPGKRGHCTVAKLARSIVAGSVRHVCEQRAAEIQALKRQVQEVCASAECRVQQIVLENAALQRELAVYRSMLGGTQRSAV